MKRALAILAIFTPALLAQQVAAPTPETVGTARGTNAGEYNIVNSFETGYRFASVGGDLGTYRADVNYRNGISLLGSNLSINSRDGHGRFFDEILLNTIGLGNDPYQAATLRVQKNRLYRYDMQWRLNDYFNPGLVVSAGQHLLDTVRRMQDHDLTLLPQSKIRFRFGYSRNHQDGPALSTIQVFDSRGDEFPLFMNVRRLRNEYRVGADLDFAGFKLTLMHRWEDFKEDTPYRLDGSTAGNNPADPTTLTQFQRSEPYHGTSPGWFGNLHTDRKYVAVNGRITYVGSRRDFLLDETAIGTNRFGAGANRQVVVGGDAARPVLAGDFSLSVFPTERLTIVNNTSIHSTRIDGDSQYLEYNNATQSTDVINFQYLGIRTVSNSTDAHYRVAKWIGLYAGYGWSNRRISTVEAFDLPPFGGDRNQYEQENTLHSGIFGVRLKPAKPVTVNLRGEIGRADHPLTPVSENRYHAIDSRIEYRLRNLTLSAAYRENYNFSPVALSEHSAQARNTSATLSWMARPWFALDASYSKLHLYTVTGLQFFAAAPRPAVVSGVDSVYLSNLHAANLGSHFSIRKRVDLYAGYTITRDTGDGRSRTANAGAPADPIGQVFLPAQTFPLTFESPLARVSVRLTPKVRLNVGWQFYHYNEDFGLLGAYQNYHAHTGYTSILWAF